MMNKIRKLDYVLIVLCVIAVIALGACSPRSVPAGDFCDVYEPVIFETDTGVAAAIRNKSELLDRRAITQILSTNRYHEENCG